MNETMEIQKLQVELLYMLPQWNYRIAKPFKQLLDDGISLEMYYCLQTLNLMGGRATMSELGKYTYMPKQQMTKMVNRLVEHQFVERTYDPSNRRIINIQITTVALDYIEHFLTQNAKCFRTLLEQMSREDRAAFQAALGTMSAIFNKLPYDMISIEENA